MTKREFLKYIPITIEHRFWGLGELEITEEVGIIEVCYRHVQKGNIVSGSKAGKNWEEVYRKLCNYLIKEGYLNREEIKY